MKREELFVLNDNIQKIMQQAGMMLALNMRSIISDKPIDKSINIKNLNNIKRLVDETLANAFRQPSTKTTKPVKEGGIQDILALSKGRRPK